ncbi:LuxR C-terminal-related transcriptional regulator [Actinoplanes sp. NPDC020271]|uniref:helix-turn-helix transcriptional regulator n=1 Tax=Actinoplanes sp. NPDC020271 TaxID=3363896 RepID=UPI0037AF0DF3
MTSSHAAVPAMASPASPGAAQTLPSVGSLAGRGASPAAAAPAGSPAAELLAQVAADPHAPLRVVVVAPGGYGKTQLLHELAALWQRAGVPVTTPWQATGATDEQVLLADDAHRLDPIKIEELRAYADKPSARIVVACRPWPRPDGLADLVDLLRRVREPVRPAPLSAEQIRERLTNPSPELVAAIAEQTGGVPRYVTRMVEARTPAEALVGFAPELDDLEPDVRTLLLAAEAGAGLSFDLVAALLGRNAGTVAELVDAGRATGLLAADGTLLPLARRAIAALGPIGHRIDVRQRLAALQLARGGPVLPLVAPLLRDSGGGLTPGGLAPGAVGGLGPVYEAAGEEALGDDPRLAAQLFAAAAGAGRGTAARRALATALAGDLDEASRLADQALSGGTPEQRAEAAYVAAAVLTQRGQTAQAATLFRWSPSPVAAAFSTVALIGTGQRAGIDGTADARQAGAAPPTLLDSAAALMARGMAESVDGTPAAALSALVQAAAMIGPAGPAVLLPDTPAALGAIVALHCAELDTADALLDRAVRTGTGSALLADRHRLLQAWVGMQRGQSVDVPDVPAPTGRRGPNGEPGSEPAARPGADGRPGQDGQAGGDSQSGTGYSAGQLADPGRDGRLARDAQPGPDGRLAQEGRAGRDGRLAQEGRAGRDGLFAGALRAGLSRRAGDLVGLRSCWPDACHALIGQPVDLFTLLPLGELAVAAARLGERHRVAGHLAEADRLLAALGDPPLWTAPLHWSRLHAAILAEDREAAGRHARALAAVRDFSPYTAAVATAAARWLEVLEGEPAPETVIDAARGLSALGLVGEGARLVGQAAIRTTDRKAMTLLLECARSLRGGAVEVPLDEGPRLLSDREREVAALILSGLTYKQIAERLYLSAKTVEHHVARIRQRLGVTGRPELLSRLRDLIDPEDEQ